MAEKNKEKRTRVSAKIRRFRKDDISQLIEVYKSAFAEEPWNEYMKCRKCGVNFGRQETESIKSGTSCKKCGSLLELAEFWSAVDIIGDLKFALSMPKPVVLIAEVSSSIVGFVWGYGLPFEKFPFLEGKIAKGSNYMDEIAVASCFRKMGIGTQLASEYVSSLDSGLKGLFGLQRDLVLRTDERNCASISLFRKLGFVPIPDQCNPKGSVYDPEFPNRIYLRLDQERYILQKIGPCFPYPMIR